MSNLFSSESRLSAFTPIGKILILPKSAAKDFTSNSPWACISISTHPDDFPHLNRCQRVDKLKLAFADLVEIRGGTLLAYPDLEHRLFSEEQAGQVLDFVEKWWDKIDLFMVHCYAGVSRSPAVGAAIAKIYTGEDTPFFEHFSPNSLVYSTILKVARERGKI